ncbi:MAG: D-hexose-6-phosphate mutarotase [Thiohalomonadales bacterium]
MNEFLNLLNKKFAIDGSVVIKEIDPSEKNSLLYIDINNEFASATIHLQGAHLTAWAPNNAVPVIWLSEAAKFVSNKSIRGGIPICWPWFGENQTNREYPAHGFARTVLWEIESIEILNSGKTQVILSLPQNNIPSTQWQFNTQVQCIFTIGQTLELEIVTYNHGKEKIVIGEALHTYFNVCDVRNILIVGLDECEYLDKLEKFKNKTQSGSIAIKQEIDRIYLSTLQDCIIEDLGFNRRIKILKKGSLSTIVWNPWCDTANKMGDLGDNGYLNMICVESANAAQNVVTIEPEQKHSLFVQYTIEEIE